MINPEKHSSLYGLEMENVHINNYSFRIITCLISVHAVYADTNVSNIANISWLYWYGCFIVMSKLMSAVGTLYLFFIKRCSLFCKASSIGLWELWALASATPCGRLELGLRSWQAVMSPAVPGETQNNMSVKRIVLHEEACVLIPSKSSQWFTKLGCTNTT